MMKKLMAVVCAAALAGCAGGFGGKAELAKDGKAKAVIVIAKNADKAARFAADELKLHLDKITGGDFKIVENEEAKTARPEVAPYRIFVGPSAGTTAKKGDFALQEYKVEVRPDAIELIGFDKDDKGRGMPGVFDAQGTMYAVYDFLENTLGVVWADATDYGTYLPKDPDLAVGFTSRRAKPFIDYRGGSAGLDQDRFDAHFWKSGTPEDKEYERLAFGGDAKKRKAANALYLRRHRIGGDKAPANHSFYWCYDRFWYKDNKRFVAYHPEYFAKGYVGEPPQMCYTDEGFIRQTVEDIRAYFDNGGYTNVYRNVGARGYGWGENNYCLEPMDNTSFCKCPKCTAEYEPERAGEHSEQSTHWFRFVNRIAREIRKTHPTKRITTLAYAAHEGVPTGFALEDNVTVYFCISGNRTCYSDLLPAQLARVREWREKFPKQRMALWLYNGFPLEIANNGGFHAFPGFFADEAWRQFRLFKELDVTKGIFFCGIGETVDAFLSMEWCMDPDRTPDELLDRYFRTYGKAGPALKEFYRTVERRYCDKSLYPPKAVHQTVHLAWKVLGNKETMDRLAGLMAEAEAAATTPEEKAHVAIWKLAVWDYMKSGYDSFTVRDAAPRPQWTAKRVPDAAGDPDKVAWDRVPKAATPLYVKGGDEVRKDLKEEIRWAHDGKFLYLEMTEWTDPTKLTISPGIASHDTWEWLFALQNAQPYRYYLSGPDGRILGASYGEVNWRQNVPAKESGDPAYWAKCRTDRTAADHWTSRWAFPLDRMLDKPVRPGDTFFANATRVMSTELCDVPRFGIFTLCSHTTVHTCDRSAAVTLEK